MEQTLTLEIHGNAATYTRADGWWSNDTMMQRYLARVCPEGATADEALAVANKEYGAACKEVQWPDPETSPQVHTR
jgi:hypothetical protein